MALTGRAVLLALLATLPVGLLPSWWTVLVVALLLVALVVADALLATPVSALRLARSGATGCRLGDGADERWWAGCSVPRAAARAMLKRLGTGGVVSCFLSPHYAAHVEVALGMLRPEQAVIAITPDERSLRVMLQCEDFSEQFAAHRLGGEWFAADDELLAHIASLGAGLDDPWQAYALWVSEAVALRGSQRV